MITAKKIKKKENKIFVPEKLDSDILHFASKIRGSYIFYTVVLQVPSHIISMDYRSFDDNGDSSINNYVISTPNLIFIFNFKQNVNKLTMVDSQIFASNFPIKSLDDDLYYCPLPNNDHGDICWGNVDIKTKLKNPIEYARQLINSYLKSGFSDGLGDHLEDLSWKEYAKLSAKNIKYGEKIRLGKACINIKNFLEESNYGN